MFSKLFHRHKTPEPNFAQGLFLALIFLFVIITQVKPAVGLAGLGATLIIGAVLIELNAARIWETYRKAYKKNKGMQGVWSEPKKLYYDLNVRVLWPIVGALGVGCLWVAYLLN